MSRVKLLRDLVGADDASIPQVWARRVQASPHRRFLLWKDESWSYGEAWDRIRRFAGFLTAHGLGGKGQRVATFLGNRPEVLWTWFGAQLTGAVYVGLNRRHRGVLLADMLTRSRARLLVTENSALDQLPDLRKCGIDYVMVLDQERPTPVQHGTVLSFKDALEAEPSDGIPLLPSDLAVVVYTSGTTGRSKAVRLPHNAYCRGAARFAEAYGLGESDVFHTWFPLYHVGGQIHATMSMVLVGGAVALVPTFSASRFWDQVKRMRATIFAGLGGMLTILWNQPPRPDDGKSTLRIGLCAPVAADMHRQFEQRFGIKILDQYGMSEAEFITLPDNSPIGSCGRAGPDYDVAIFDEHDRALPAHRTGEIVCRPKAADLIFQGYEDDDAATVRAWRNLWFHTGDLGYRDDDGYFYWVDRESHAIRRRGENVSSWELEQIIQSHPQVAECAVVGVPSPLGEEDVKAVVVPRNGSQLDSRGLHAFCAERMAHFMVPRYIEIRQALPLTPSEKVEKEKLRETAGVLWDAQNGEATQ